MKKIKIKRLVFTNKYGGGYIGAGEYDGNLTDENILGSFHQVGKTVWQGSNLYMLVDGEPLLRVTVDTFYQYQKRWYESLLDAIRRI